MKRRRKIKRREIKAAATSGYSYSDTRIEARRIVFVLDSQ